MCHNWLPPLQGAVDLFRVKEERGLFDISATQRIPAESFVAQGISTIVASRPLVAFLDIAWARCGPSVGQV